MFYNFVDLLRRRATYQGNQVAFNFLVDGEESIESITYYELDQKARAIAATLQSFNVLGQRALLLYPPGLDFISAFLGCLYAGVIAVPLDMPSRGQKMASFQKILTNSQATLVLANSLLQHAARTRLRQTPEIQNIHWIATDGIPLDQCDSWLELSPNSSTLAFLQYTSGTTGFPKGVMITHGNLIHNSTLIQYGFSNDRELHGIIWLPHYHDMGLIGGVLQPIYVGGSATLMSPLNFLQKPIRWLNAISRFKGTISGGPNFAYDLCVQKIKLDQCKNLDLSNWELAFNGAEPVRAETQELFSKTFEPFGFRREAFYPCYGIAEATLIISGSTKELPPIVKYVQRDALQHNKVIFVEKQSTQSWKLVSCGKNFPDQRITIVNPKTRHLCNESEIGEIWVSGPSVAQGYWNRQLETEQTFNAYIAESGKGSFLRTGDLGFLQDGELYVTGRLKDVIIIRGRNYYPQDIELTVEISHRGLRIAAEKFWPLRKVNLGENP